MANAQSKKSPMSSLVPRLIVRGADAALAFYARAFGATIHDRYADQALGLVVHAEVRFGNGRFTLADEHLAWGNAAPPSLGGTPVVMTLHVADADAAGERFTRAGGEELIPIEDRFYGAREGRFRDPFGHVWIVSQELRRLWRRTIQRGVDTFHDVPERPSPSRATAKRAPRPKTKKKKTR